MTGSEPRLPTGNSDPLKNILDILGTLGTGTTTSRSSVEGNVGSQADELIKSIMGSVNPDNMANLVQGILLKAKAGLGPNIAASLGAGNRSVSDSSLASLQSEAAAKATAESAQAILEAQTHAQNIAGSIVNTKLNTSKVTTSRTGISPTAKAFGALSLYDKGKKLLSKNSADSELPEQLGGPGFDNSVTSVIPDSYGVGSNSSGNFGDSGFDFGGGSNLAVGAIDNPFLGDTSGDIIPIDSGGIDNPFVGGDAGNAPPEDTGTQVNVGGSQPDQPGPDRPSGEPGNPDGGGGGDGSDGGGDGSVLGWIICTELHKQGKLPTRYYIYGARAFAKYPDYGKQAYYVWAIPCVKWLRKYPYSLFSRFLESIFNARAEYLAAKEGLRGAKKSFKGLVVIGVTYALCWVISKFNPTPVNPLKELETSNGKHA